MRDAARPAPPGVAPLWAAAAAAASVLLHLLHLLLLLLHASVAACPSSCRCTERNGLTAVQCASRNLERIPADLPRDTAVLLLAANRITRVPSHAFAELHRLQELDLSGNDIETVDAGAFLGVSDSLLLLDLSGNRIRSVPREALARLRAEISLSDNPWHCECGLQEALRELRLDPRTVNELRCHTAAQQDYAGKPVIQVLDSGINFCNFHHKTTDVAMFVAMFGWFAMVVAYVIYYIRHNQEDVRRHLEQQLKAPPPPPPGDSRVGKDLDTVSTGL